MRDGERAEQQEAGNHEEDRNTGIEPSQQAGERTTQSVAALETHVRREDRERSHGAELIECREPAFGAGSAHFGTA